MVNVLTEVTVEVDSFAASCGVHCGHEWADLINNDLAQVRLFYWADTWTDPIALVLDSGFQLGVIGSPRF